MRNSEGTIVRNLVRGPNKGELPFPEVDTLSEKCKQNLDFNI